MGPLFAETIAFQPETIESHSTQRKSLSPLLSLPSTQFTFLLFWCLACISPPRNFVSSLPLFVCLVVYETHFL